MYLKDMFLDPGNFKLGIMAFILSLDTMEASLITSTTYLLSGLRSAPRLFRRASRASTPPSSTSGSSSLFGLSSSEEEVKGEEVDQGKDLAPTMVVALAPATVAHVLVRRAYQTPPLLRKCKRKTPNVGTPKTKMKGEGKGLASNLTPTETLEVRNPKFVAVKLRQQVTTVNILKGHETCLAKDKLSCFHRT
ncbi:hypothetical protein Acr_06g0009270 [Actinidia rufa]|uniref:Uncharacterized protein n=1 Tax=Actinidia rufa TaxID=165716 RepID=A0A7J0ETT1_9ERIC|nr:hypothetical protein Acr_06g0009270 [Actinidia rufa]